MECLLCGGEGYIAVGNPNKGFLDLVNNAVCWECYVAVIRRKHIDRKLKIAKTKAQNLSDKLMHGHPTWEENDRWTKAFLRHKRNIEAWQAAIEKHGHYLYKWREYCESQTL